MDKGQVLKWTIYSLLLINWGYYFIEEIYISSHTLRQGGPFLEWTREFASTIDEFAWFGLHFFDDQLQGAGEFSARLFRNPTRAPIAP